jgi:hypothetical protein
MLWRETGPTEAGPFHESELKICELCGALNLESNPECFVCGWHGRFERRPEVVRIAMELLARQHGRLELRLLTDPHLYKAVTRRTLGSRIRLFFARARHWLFG